MIYLENEQATLAFGEQLSEQLSTGAIVYLQGDLGAGKTTLTRGLLKGFGYQGAVKSPTYTLVEVYPLPSIDVYHYDLYRLTDPEELEFIDAREQMTSENLCIIEWPSKGKGWLPAPDLIIRLEIVDQARHIYLDWQK